MHVSVIIPTFNRAPLLPQAIDSVLRQTLADREIIVVDDGSTDDTAAVVAGYGSAVRYVRTEHGGVGHARNVGTLQARGRYLVFLDSDDLLYPYALELQAAVLDRHPELALVYAEASGFDDQGFWEECHLRTYHASGYRGHRTFDDLFGAGVPLGEAGVLTPDLAAARPDMAGRRFFSGRIFDAYLLDLVVFTASLMMRREVVADVGLRNEAVAYWEEVDYVLRICRRHPVGFLDVPTYLVRYHAGQVSTTKRANGKYIWLRKQQGLLRIVRRHGTGDRAYYEAHREDIDRQLARLHRAVAIPLLLFPGGTGQTRRRYARRARPYLRRCAQLGRPEPWLWWLSYTPGFVRQFGVTVIERLRKRR